MKTNMWKGDKDGSWLKSSRLKQSILSYEDLDQDMFLS
jgi:hypothetical protein